MSSVVIAGNTSGSITLAAPDVAGTTTLTLPATSGQVLTQNPSAPANSFVVNASGNVGIGTASPNFNSASGTVCHINNSTAGAWAINHYTNGTTGSAAADGFIVGSLGADAYLFNYEASPMIFATSAAERMRIDSSGRVLVGRTSAYSDGSIGNATFQTVSVTGSNAGIAVTANTTTNTIQIGFVNPNGTVGSIQSAASATSYNTASDYRLKENIAPMIGALDTVAQLKPVTYKWKVDGSKGQGFIAHELAEIVPDCVSGKKDAVDKDGNPQYQGIDTSFLVATLTAAIQEQQAIINDLKARIETLEGAA